jgi:tRNA-dihydrouridine synthase
MSDNELNEIKQTLAEVKNAQTNLMNISKKHLELYAQQIAKADELNNTFHELQRQSQQHQRVALILALVTIFAVAAYVILVSG